MQHVNQSQQIPPQQHPHIHHIQPQHMNANTGGPPIIGMGQTQQHINVPPQQPQQQNTLQAPSQLQQAQHNANYHHNQRDPNR